MRGLLLEIMKYLVFGVVLISCVAAQEVVTFISCDTNSTCTSLQSLPNNTYCLNSFCACPDEDNNIYNCSVSSIASVKDKPTVPLVGRACKRDTECNLENGFCNTGRSQCECNKNYIPSSNGHKCLPVPQTYGSDCEDDKQCLAHLPNTICLNKTVCSCIENYHFTDNACWKTAELNESCSNNQECSLVTDAECNNEGICACPVGKVVNDDATRCLPTAQEFRAECSESVQCSNTFGDKSECIDKICQCRENFHYVSTLKKCIANKALGEACTAHDECYQGEGKQKGFQCLEERCACAKGFNQVGRTCTTSGSSTMTYSIVLVLSMLFFLA